MTTSVGEARVSEGVDEPRPRTSGAAVGVCSVTAPYVYGTVAER